MKIVLRFQNMKNGRRIYTPICNNAKSIVKLTRSSYLTDEDIILLKALHFTVEVK